MGHFSFARIYLERRTTNIFIVNLVHSVSLVVKYFTTKFTKLFFHKGH